MNNSASPKAIAALVFLVSGIACRDGGADRPVDPGAVTPGVVGKIDSRVGDDARLTAMATLQRELAAIALLPTTDAARARMSWLKTRTDQLSRARVAPAADELAWSPFAPYSTANARDKQAGAFEGTNHQAWLDQHLDVTYADLSYHFDDASLLQASALLTQVTLENTPPCSAGQSLSVATSHHASDGVAGDLFAASYATSNCPV